MHVLPGDMEKEQLLKAIWMSLVATFVVQGRPKLSLSQQKQHQQHQPMMAEVNPQDAVGNDDEDDEEVGYFGAAGGMKVPSGRWKSLAQDAIHADHQIVSKVHFLISLTWTCISNAILLGSSIWPMLTTFFVFFNLCATNRL
jgi:hypothetical protein